MLGKELIDAQSLGGTVKWIKRRVAFTQRDGIAKAIENGQQFAEPPDTGLIQRLRSSSAARATAISARRDWAGLVRAAGSSRGIRLRKGRRTGRSGSRAARPRPEMRAPHPKQRNWCRLSFILGVSLPAWAAFAQLASWKPMLLNRYCCCLVAVGASCVLRHRRHSASPPPPTWSLCCHRFSISFDQATGIHAEATYQASAMLDHPDSEWRTVRSLSLRGSELSQATHRRRTGRRDLQPRRPLFMPEAPWSCGRARIPRYRHHRLNCSAIQAASGLPSPILIARLTAGPRSRP